MLLTDDALGEANIAWFPPLTGELGRILTDPIRAFFDSAGAVLMVPSEQHGIGIERYGCQFRIPAISLGWFGWGSEHDDLVRIPVEGMTLHTELAILHALGDPAGNAVTFWDYARAMVEAAVSS